VVVLTGALLSFSTHVFAVLHVKPEPTVSEKYFNPELENEGHTFPAAVAGTSDIAATTPVVTSARTATATHARRIIEDLEMSSTNSTRGWIVRRCSW
jgi:hypothetical protein